MAYLNVPSWHSHGQTKENQEKCYKLMQGTLKIYIIPRSKDTGIL